MRASGQAQDGEGGQRGALGQAVDDQKFLRCCGSCRRARPSCRPRARRRRRYCCRRTPRPMACQAIALAKVGAGLFDQVEQRFGLGRHRLGRAAEAAADLDRHVVLGRDRGDRSSSIARLALGLDLGRSRPQVDAQHGEVGDDIARAPALDPRRIDAEAVALQPRRAAARGRRRRAARCARPRGCARHGPSGRARRSRNCRCPAALRPAFRRAEPPAHRSAPRACPAPPARAAAPTTASRPPRRC